MNKFSPYSIILFIFLVACQKEARVVDSNDNIDESFQFSEFHNSQNSELLSNYINQIVLKNDQLYIATDSGYCIIKNNILSMHLLNVYGISNSKVNCIEKQGDVLWLGTDSGLLKIDEFSYHLYTTSNSPLPLNKIRSLALVNGNLWIGTFGGGGLAKFDGDNWEVFTPNNSGLPNNSVGAIKSDLEGNIWIGTGGGLSYFNGSFTNYSPGNSGLPNGKVYDIDIDLNGIVWVGTNGGLSSFDGNEWTTYSEQNSELSLNLIRSISINNNEIWIGTEGQGVSIFNRVSQGFTNYNFSNSNLCNNFVTSIISSDETWIGTSNGLMKL